MQTRLYDDECMHDFSFQGKNIVVFRSFKFFWFFIFWKARDITSGTISIHGQVQDALRCVETAYQAAASENPSDEDTKEALERPPKKKQLFSQEKTTTKQVSLGASGSEASVTIGAGLPSK